MAASFSGEADFPDQVHDAGLHDGLREHRGDRLRKALDTVDDGDDVIDAAGGEPADHLEPESGAFGLVRSKAQARS